MSCEGRLKETLLDLFGVDVAESAFFDFFKIPVRGDAAGDTKTFVDRFRGLTTFGEEFALDVETDVRDVTLAEIVDIFSIFTINFLMMT